jgi:O-antigen ligase
MRSVFNFDRRCYWLFLIFAVNVPGFTKFDVTGRTHDLGLVNPQSISHVALTLLVACCALIIFLSRQTYAAFAQVRKSLVVLLSLYVLFLLTSLPWEAKDVVLSVYRLFEWGLAILLTVGLFASSPEQTDKLSAELLFRIAATVLCIVALIALISPDLALQTISEETGFVDYRFGGAVYPPNTVGTLAGIALYYVILFRRGGRRMVEALFFAAALVLTYSRGALIAFAIGYFVVGILFGRPLVRLFNILIALTVCAMAVLYQDKLIAILSRGKSVGSLTAASGRLMIWTAGWRMFLVHPFRGWGFVSGVRHYLPKYYFNTTFAPQHLHNEFLQAVVSGGLIAGLFVVAVFGTGLYRGFRLVRLSLWQQFLLCAFIQVFIHSLEGPVFCAEYMTVGACGLICVTSFGLVQRYCLPYWNQQQREEHLLKDNVLDVAVGFRFGGSPQ